MWLVLLRSVIPCDSWRASCCCVAMGATLWLTPSMFAQREDPVRSGHQAFKSQGSWDWYDSGRDRLAPLPQSSGSQYQGDHRRQAEQNFRESQWRERGRTGGWEESTYQSRIEPGTGAGLNLVAWILVGLLLVAFVVAIAMAIMRADFSRKKKNDKSRSLEDEPARNEALPFEVDSESDYLKAARARYEKGDFRQAMVFLYAYLLLTLDEAQQIRLARGKTNRQYLAELVAPEVATGSRWSMARFFREAMFRFELAFFGQRDLSRDEFESTWNQLDSFHQSVGTSA